MFEDVCLVCGRIADGLYCSDVCRDADAVQLPPSSIDHAIDLGFITDSIPPLVSSTRPPRNPEDPSAVSSPTSSILTTPSVLDELDSENSDPHLGLPATNGIHQKGHDPSTITATTAMTSAGTVLDSLLLPPTIQKIQPPSSPIPHLHLPHPQTNQQQQLPSPQVRSPRLQPTTGGGGGAPQQQPALLPFARKPGNTNIHTPPPSTQHHSSSAAHHHHHAHPSQSGSSSSCSRGGGGSGQHHHGHHRRAASFNPALSVPPSAGGVNPGGAGTPGPILGGAGVACASPFSPNSRGLLTVHQHHSSSSSHSHSRCSTSGHPSPALSPLRISNADNESDNIDRAGLLANLEELDLDGARGDPRMRARAPHQQHVHRQHGQHSQEDQDALEKARKRRARASLPAYFSNLMMGVTGVHTSSSKVPSTAVSSGTSSSDEQHQKQRQQQRQQKLRHVRSKSAMRASDRAAAKILSTSASTFKVGGPTRSNSGGSIDDSAQRVTSQAQSPTTPTVLTRNGSRNQLLAYFNNSGSTGKDSTSPPPRGRDREKVRGRVRGINTSVGGVAMTPSVEAIVSPITAMRHSLTPPGVLIHNDGVTAGGVSPASFAEKHIRFIASSVANGNHLGGRRMFAALQGLRSPPPPAAATPAGLPSSSSTGVLVEEKSPSSPIAIRTGSSSSSRPRLSVGILEEGVEVPFVVPAGSNYTRALAPSRLHHRLGGGVGVGGRVNALTMSPKSRRYSSPTTSTAGIGAGLHVPIALMMSPAIERPAKPTAIPGAHPNAAANEVTNVFGRGGRRNSRREEEMSPQRPVIRRGWSPVRGRGAAVFDDDDEEEEEEEEEEEKEENDDADEEEEEEEEEPQRGRSRSRMRSRSRARSRSLERRHGGHRRSFGVAGY